MSVFKEMKDEIVARFKTDMEKVAAERDAIQKIHDRNFLQRLFANNTRDIARAGIAQNELISDLHKDLQDVLQLVRKDASVCKEIIAIVTDLKIEHAQFADDFRRNFCELLINTANLKTRVDNLSRGSRDIGTRIASLEQVERIKTEIGNIAIKQGASMKVKFHDVCRAVSEHLAGVSIADGYKQSIGLCARKEFRLAKISGGDLNEIQPDVTALFENFLAVRNRRANIINRYVFDKISLPKEEEYDMGELISDVVDAVTVSESDRYCGYRDQLLELLDDFLREKVAEEDHEAELLAIRKRLKESQFEIALVGEFQGGKSTTFNMLCGGREISPRGLNGGGIKTSAAVVTAQNIAENETKNGLEEWAEISWLTAEQLKERILTVLKDYDDGKLLTPDIIGTSWDNITELLKRAWAKPLTGDHLDLLRIATLQWKLCRSGVLPTSVEKEDIVPIDKFQELVKFPAKWEQRWTAKLDADFSLEEIRFAAVDRVLVRIHSPELERLGCRITDCPGLFVSKWDTERALGVMRNANAIWYLLNGDKQIGDNDERGLQQIKDRSWQEKCFFSLNRRKGLENTNEIKEVDTAKLKSWGFDPEHVFMYDAFLSFRLEQLENIDFLRGEQDLKCLAIESSKSSDAFEAVVHELRTAPEKCPKLVLRMIRRHLNDIREDDMYDEVEALSDGGGITPDLIAKLKQISGEQDILNSIEKWIIVNRAYSILISEGSKKCQAILGNFKEKLQMLELAASKTLEDAQREADEAKQKLDDFVCEWEKRFNFLRTDSLDDGLAVDFFQDNDLEIRAQIKERAIKICKEEWHGSHWFTEDVNRATENRIQEAFSSLIQAKLETYQQGLKKRVKFEESIGKPLLQNLNEMAEKWSELKTQNDLLKGIDLVEPAQVEAVSFDSFDNKIKGTVDAPMYCVQWLITIFTLGVKSADVRIEEFFNKNDPVGQAYNAFKGDSENHKKISHILGTLRRDYLKLLDECVVKMKKSLQDNIDRHVKLVQENNREKERIADDARDKRERIIEPYSAKIEEYQQEVSRFYDKKSC